MFCSRRLPTRADVCDSVVVVESVCVRGWTELEHAKLRRNPQTSTGDLSRERCVASQVTEFTDRSGPYTNVRLVIYLQATCNMNASILMALDSRQSVGTIDDYGM